MDDIFHINNNHAREVTSMNNTKEIDSFNDVESIIEKPEHAHSDVVLNLYERHQVWFAVESSSTSTATSKARCWYIINPEIGAGKVLAAPISKSYVNGIPIDIGKNFIMYIHPENCTAISVAVLKKYLGVAPRIVQELMEKYLRFLYLGDRSLLDDLEIIQEGIRNQETIYVSEKDNLPNGFLASMSFKSKNKTALELMKRVRRTCVGEQMDVRDFYLANILAGSSVFEKDGTPNTRTYIRTNPPTPTEVSKPATPTDKKKKKASRQVILANLNEEEIEFILNYKDIEVIRNLFGFREKANVYSARRRIRLNTSLNPEKVDGDEVKKVYYRLNPKKKVDNITIKPEDAYALRTFICCVGNGKYKGMRTVFGVDPKTAIAKIAELFAQFGPF